MGNKLSTPSLLPLSFNNYFNDGKPDINKYQLYLILKQKRDEEEQILIDGGISNHLSNNKSIVQPPQKNIVTNQLKNILLL